MPRSRVRAESVCGSAAGTISPPLCHRSHPPSSLRLRCLSPSFNLPYCRMPHGRILFLSFPPILRFHPSPPIQFLSASSPSFHPNLLPLSVGTSSASWCLPVICDQRATERCGTLQCHDPETPH
ncbi:unnamed protein product [Pleuronectes platessa]|uniref:Uncharacterized protein n=1 Tax=Pleuronectes platessa TaxID=8262 RepID=A0A9N7TQF6_PLEPL|nr:unnamed protein product [Pleuronectes platessa]